MREWAEIDGDPGCWSAAASYSCPDCAAPAEVLSRWVMGSTDGPVEHLKMRCVVGHWFAMPTWMLDGEP